MRFLRGSNRDSAPFCLIWLSASYSDMLEILMRFYRGVRRDLAPSIPIWFRFKFS